MTYAFEDLDDFLEPTDFAEAATYTPAGGSATAVTVVFDRQFEVVNIETGEIETTGPGAVIKTADITGVKHGDTLLVDGDTFFIRGIQPDGQGLTTLTLSDY